VSLAVSSPLFAAQRKVLDDDDPAAMDDKEATRPVPLQATLVVTRTTSKRRAWSEPSKQERGRMASDYHLQPGRLLGQFESSAAPEHKDQDMEAGQPLAEVVESPPPGFDEDPHFDHDDRNLGGNVDASSTAASTTRSTVTTMTTMTTTMTTVSSTACAMEEDELESDELFGDEDVDMGVADEERAPREEFEAWLEDHASSRNLYPDMELEQMTQEQKAREFGLDAEMTQERLQQLPKLPGSGFTDWSRARAVIETEADNEYNNAQQPVLVAPTAG